MASLTFVRRLAALFRRRRLDAEFREEIAQHIALRRQALEDGGMDPREAAYEAQKLFGNVTVIHEETRAMWGFPSVETMLQDLRYGGRLLRRSPMFTIVAVLSLAIGIGATAAVFSLADSLFFRPLPVPHPEQLSVIKWRSGPIFPFDSLDGYGEQSDDGLASTSFSLIAYRRMRAETSGMMDVFGFADLYRTNITVAGRAELGEAHAVSGNYFAVMGVPPALGRAFGDGDDRADADPAAVISHALWQRRFGGAGDAVGRGLVLNGAPFTVVGIMPPGFRGSGQVGESPDVYVPLALRGRITKSPENPDDPNVWWILMMGRLKPGATRPQAQPALDLILKQTVAAARPTMAAKDLPRVDLIAGARGQVEDRDSMREPMRTMAIVVVMVLLVACANVANLLLARGRARVRELTVRVAIGASRQRVVRQLLTEGLLLAALGSLLGVIAAQWIAGALLPALQEPNTASLATTGLNARVVIFVALLGSACAVMFALLPALRATDVSLAAGLQEASRGAASARTRGGLSSGLVVAQIALSMILVAAAVLLVRSVRQLQQVPLGFDAEHLLIFKVDPTLNGYDDPRIRQTYASILERLRHSGGVKAATLSSHMLISNSSSYGMSARLDEAAPDPRSEQSRAFRATHGVYRLNVDAQFLETMGIPLQRGRTFDARDTATGQQVAVINRALAKQLFGAEDVVGRRFRLGLLPTSPAVEVIGVCADARYASLRREMAPTVYLSVLQQPAAGVTFEVRTTGDPTALAPTAHEIVRSVDPNLPLFAVQSQSQQVAASLRRERLFAKLSTWLGVVTLGLSAIGLYALLAYTVTRRTPEIGIRMALGAGRATVRWMILRQSLVLGGCGLALGVAGAVAGTKLLEALLFGVEPRDPLAISFAAVLMLAVSALAGYLPARRASRVDPLVALRAD